VLAARANLQDAGKTGTRKVYFRHKSIKDVEKFPEKDVEKILGTFLRAFLVLALANVLCQHAVHGSCKRPATSRMHVHRHRTSGGTTGLDEEKRIFFFGPLFL